MQTFLKDVDFLRNPKMLFGSLPLSNYVLSFKSYLLTGGAHEHSTFFYFRME